MALEGAGWCRNGFEPVILGPGDSLQFSVYRDMPSHDRVRVAVALGPIGSHRWIYATTKESLDFGSLARSPTAGH